MPLMQTSGNVTADAYAGGVAAVPAYIEDVFNIGLYSASGGSETFSILGSVDMYTKGGLMWIKTRNAAASHSLIRPTLPSGGGLFCQSNTTAAQNSFGTSEFRVNSNNTVTMANGDINSGGSTYVSWNFAKQAKFFDVVTYTGTGVARTIAHSLGSVPGCIIIKRTDAGGTLWYVYHRANTSGGSAQSQELRLDNTNATNTNTDVWNNTAPTSTVFSIGAGASPYDWNASGGSYVAYLFAHNAGGFGLSGTDNVISCGSYTGNGSTDGPTIDLGYEPQWLLIKSSSAASTAWILVDNMRGMTVGGADAYLKPNSSDAETTSLDLLSPTATGFKLTSTLSSVNGANDYIYIAIRRGPMKVPTSGTSVFAPIAFNSSAGTVNTTGFPVDSQWNGLRSGDAQNANVNDRLRGISSTSTSTGVALATSSTAAERTDVTSSQGWSNTGFQTPSFLNATSTASWNFRRAPSFFDEVCYTGDGVAGRTITHNLGATPTFMIVKIRSSSRDWIVGVPSIGYNYYLQINQTDAPLLDSTIWNNTAPTASVFTVGDNIRTNGSGSTYVAYLFSTCAGVSKVGTYTGNGTTQTINCGFTGGARFVLIRRTDSTGDWYVYDTARGMTTLTDPYLLLNSTAAETATLGSVTTVSTGFALNASILAAINTNAASYIFLAIS